MSIAFQERFAFLLSVFSFLSAYGTPAQIGTTSLRGSILDPSVASVSGATVKLTEEDLGVQRVIVTSATGAFEFLSLPPGTYSLSVEASGFRGYTQRGVELLVNNPATLNVTLQIGAAKQRIEVFAGSTTINSTDASLGIAFSEIQIKQLPLESRNVGDLLSLQAGVVYTGNNPSIQQGTDTRSGSVNGARSDQSNVALDGIPVNPKGGYAFQSVLPVTLDSVEEFRVITSNAEADEGSTGGAQVALVTKSGTNKFHGSAYEYNRNSYFSANDYFLKASQLASGTSNVPQFLNRNIFGGSIGGPIRKDRLFIFMNYEAYRDVEQRSVLRIVPTASLRDGVVQYVCDRPVTCPGNTVKGYSGTSYTAAAGNYVLSPQQLTAMDPVASLPGYKGSVGPDPVILNYFKPYPLPNDLSQGDGLNTAGYRFAAPTKNTKNWYIAKMDCNITKDGNQRVSLTGALANQNAAEVPLFPGGTPIASLVNYNKGLIVNYTAAFTNNLINNFRYGFIRESVGTIGDTDQPWNYIRGISQGVIYSSEFQRPIHSFWDDLNSSHGRHQLQFGFQVSLVRNPTSSTANSFSSGDMNAPYLDTSGLAGRASSPLNPANSGYPAVDFFGFGSNYDNAVTALFGMDVEVNAQYNYQRNGTPLPQGAPVVRHFAENGYEAYVQDTWKAKPALTLTFGLRYSLFSPPWETNGLEVTPTESLNTYFNNRGVGMNNGIPSIDAPLIAFNFSGPANRGTTGYYGWDYKNLGPRVAFAWSPGFDSGLLQDLFGGAGKSSLRGGFGIVYDHIGEGLLDTFDQNGAFGLSTTISNAPGSQSVLSSPRITSLNIIPQVDNLGNTIFVPAPPSNYPQPYPSNPASGSEAISWGLDSHIKTPYSYTIDLSFQRQLSDGFILDVAYVGRLSHRLLAQEDLAMPLDPFDKKAGMDYFAAATALAKIYRQELAKGLSNPTNSFNPNSVPAGVRQYWADITQPVTPGGAYSIGGSTPYGTCAGNGLNSTNDPTVLAFDLLCGNSLNESLSVYEMDISGVPDAANPNNLYFYHLGNYTGPNVFYSPQYSSLYALRTVTNANYNALQITLQHKILHGIQFDFNYTYGKSIDVASDAERVGEWGGLGGQIINAWDPKSNRGPSDFDLRHQFNSNFIWELPFGHGKPIANDSSKANDALIGGWKLSGLLRWTSGFPVNVDNGAEFPTNFNLEGLADQVCPVRTGTYYTGPANTGVGNSAPNLFSNGVDAASCFAYPYPGGTGGRNQIRGPGFFGIDLGLAKRWKMPWSDQHTLQFRWEIFNVTNSVRFNVQSASASTGGSLENGNSANFGNFTGTLTNPRIVQFALRYEF